MTMLALQSVPVTNYALAGSLVLIYVAARTFIAISGCQMRVTPFALAVAQVIPVAVAAMAALLVKQPEVGVALVFAVALANVSLVLGLSRIAGPLDQGHDGQAASVRRTIALLLPVAIIVLLCGFRGRFTTLHLGVLLIEGLAILGFTRALARQDRSREGYELDLLPKEEPQPRAGLGWSWRLAWGAVAALLVVIGVALFETMIRQPGSPLQRLGAPLHGSALLAPVLLLPMIAMCVALAQRGRGAVVAESTVMATLIHLCVVIPVLIGFWALCQYTPIHAKVSELLARVPLAAPTETSAVPTYLPFPMSSWRIDTVGLIVVGVLLLGVASRRINLTRLVGVLLVVGYMFYLGIGGAIGMR